MNPTTPAIKALARRLIAFEASCKTTDGAVDAAIRACGALRAPLVKLVGAAGYYSLLSRALAMAKAEVSSLGPVRVRPDGSFEGWEVVERDRDADAGVVVVTHLLGLLVTFIGEPLTLRLVSEAWPDAAEAATDPFGGGQS